jgi:pSer/pThr/pTyr-binding forkhead associated (FHA) protein
MSILTVTSGPMAGRSVTIDQRVVVGRRADVSIDDDELSRRHFAVHAIADGILVEDLDSTNGTFVGDDRITGSMTVPGGTLIRAGRSEFTVDLHPGEAAAGRVDIAAPDERTRLGAQVPAPVRPPTAAMPLAADASATPPAPSPGAAVSPSHAASPPPETPNGRRPGDAGLPRRRATTASRVAPIALMILLAGAVVLTLVILGSSSAQKQTRPVSFYIRTTTRVETGTTSAIDGLQTGPPTGGGAALVTQTVTAPTGGALFATGAATPFMWQLATFFQTGSVRATITGTATRGEGGSLVYTGKGPIVGGTGTFKEASGTLTLSGTVPPPGSEAAALATQKGANGQGGGGYSATTNTPPPAVPLTDGGVFAITGSIRY